MNDKTSEDRKKSNDSWNENDILNDDMFNISNMSNMISMSNIYMPNTAGIVSINDSNVLQDITTEKTPRNKK